MSTELTPEQRANLPDFQAPAKVSDLDALERVNRCLATARQIRRMREAAERGERIEEAAK